MNKLITIATCLIATALLNAQSRIYASLNGTGSGVSWATACNLETAVKNATSGTEIRVQKGTYYPSKMLAIMPSVKVYGGFAGTETALSQRNLTANPTIIDAQQKFGSVFRLSVSSELDGFTIQNGKAQNNPNYNGGGVWADGNTTIRYCTITNNTAFANGGGSHPNGFGGGLSAGINNSLGQSTQTAGYAFGTGQTGATQTVTGYGGNGGGGGGWYGGRADAGRGNGHTHVGGNGGSGFISGHPGCNAVDSNGAHTGSPIHYSGIEFTGTQMLTGAQSMPNPRGEGEITGNPGHGFIRITIFLN